jgi:hypothetical protein
MLSHLVLRRSFRSVITHRFIERTTKTRVFHPHILTMASSTAVNASRFLADENPPLCSLSVKDSFALLTDKEKLYTHWVGAASWAGARIIQEQWTPEAQTLYDFLILVFSTNDGKSLADLEALKSKSKSGNEEWVQLLEYVAQVRLARFSNQTIDQLLAVCVSRFFPIWSTINLSDLPSSFPEYLKVGLGRSSKLRPLHRRRYPCGRRYAVAH